MARVKLGKSNQLVAKQIIPLQHPEGVSLAMVSDDGKIYLHTDEGWKAMDMTEVKGGT